MTTREYTLPWPPSINGYWRAVRMGKGCRQIISERGRVFRNAAAVAVAEAGGGAIDGRLDVRIVLHPPTRRRCDIDNYAKAILDALEHAGVYEDDGAIDRLEVVRGRVVLGGRANVRVQAEKPVGAKLTLEQCEWLMPRLAEAVGCSEGVLYETSKSRGAAGVCRKRVARLLQSIGVDGETGGEAMMCSPGAFLWRAREGRNYPPVELPSEVVSKVSAWITSSGGTPPAWMANGTAR